MSMTLSKKQKTSKGQGASSASKAKDRLGAPEWAQVDLLPPEVLAGRKLSTTKRVLALSLVGTLALCGMGYVWSTFEVQSADERLADAESQAMTLRKERQKYAEVPVVLNAITDATAARFVGLSTEISWAPYVRAVSAVIPQGATITSVAIAQVSPSAMLAEVADPLLDAGVGQVVFTVEVPTMPTAAEWKDALETIPGFMDATLQSAAINEQDGDVFYELSTTVQVDESAFSLRFLDESAGAPEAAPAADAEGEN